MTYQFTADHPGTFLYQSGTDPAKQVQMGLFGALVVRPSMGASFAYNDGSTQFNPGAEFLILLSEIDPTLHARAEAGQGVQHEQLPPALLDDQRPRVPRLDRR